MGKASQTSGLNLRGGGIAEPSPVGYLELFTRLGVKLAQNSENSGNTGLDNARQIVEKFGNIVAQMRKDNNDPFGEILVVADRREVTERLLFRQTVPILNAHHRDPVELLHEVAALFADQNPSYAKIRAGQDLEGDLVDAIVDVLRDFDWGGWRKIRGQGCHCPSKLPQRRVPAKFGSKV